MPPATTEIGLLTAIAELFHASALGGRSKRAGHFFGVFFLYDERTVDGHAQHDFSIGSMLLLLLLLLLFFVVTRQFVRQHHHQST